MSKIIVLKMPSLSPTMKTGNLVKWCKNIGDKVKLGEVIAEIETDKAIMEMESPGSGVLKKILVEAGSNDVLVETNIGVLADENALDEDINVMLSGSKNGNVSQKTGSQEVTIDMQRVGGYEKKNKTDAGVNEVNAGVMLEQASHKIETQPFQTKQERIIISPYAKHLLTHYDLLDHINKITGTGEKGTITSSDVENYKNSYDTNNAQTDNAGLQNGVLQNAGLKIDKTLIQMNNMRKAIARKVVHSKQTVPHFYVSADLDITALEAAKQDLFNKYEVKTTINDWFMLACAKALKAYPALNQVWEVENESLLQYKQIDINCAIDVGAGPLLVLLSDVGSKGLLQIRDEMKHLVQLAKDKTIKAEHLATGTFSISNLGMFKVASFSAIINPPQVAVLAIGCARNGVCTVTVSCDHRVLDGRDAALFLQELRKMIESPLQMLL